MSGLRAGMTAAILLTALGLSSCAVGVGPGYGDGSYVGVGYAGDYYDPCCYGGGGWGWGGRYHVGPPGGGGFQRGGPHGGGPRPGGPVGGGHGGGGRPAPSIPGGHAGGGGHPR